MTTGQSDAICPPEYIEKLSSAFTDTFGGEFAPQHIVSAPGRVNLIGEHVDYNDGLVFPIAIDRHIHAAVAPRDDQTVRVVASDVPGHCEFSLSETKPHADRWQNYIRGCAVELAKVGFELTGIDISVSGDVPVGAGVSSSAAMELAASQAFLTAAGHSMPLQDLAVLCQRVENSFVGVSCGIMDQYICAMGQKNAAMLLDCESLEYELVSIPEDTLFVVCDTRKARELGDSAYNERRGQCEAGAAHLGVKSLRYATMDQLEAARGSLDEVVWRRCRHVLTEIERTTKAAAVLQAGGLDEFGRLMNESHESLRDDYEVSCRELDMMVASAREAPGCFGARLTGAGFGGCAVAMVDPAHIDAFTSQTSAKYEELTALEPVLYPVTASQGVSVAAL